MTDPRRALPSVDRLLKLPGVAALIGAHPRDLVTRAVRLAVAEARKPGIGSREPGIADGEWERRVAHQVETLATPTLRRVVNATGVVLHTNLGRAPLAAAALEAIRHAAAGYTTLEYDVERGARGSRHVHCAGLITELTGAADALVVNNAAAALVLALAASAAGGDAIVSRGELIEIGGGFRIPEIMETSGVTLVEVGTTNRTRVADYEAAVQACRRAGVQRRGSARARTPVRPHALLKVHRSNFAQIGFTAEASLEELVALGRKRRVSVLYDLGGGLMRGLSDIGLAGEPTLPEAVRSGATLVIASGDKLLGGPQAGILAGTRSFIAKCRAHPFARAARADKLTLAGLAATLELYRDPERARREVPVLRMLTTPADALRPVAAALLAALPASARATVVATRAAVGGGAFPGASLESVGLALAPAGITPNVLAARLRRGAVPVIGVVDRNRCVLDVRTMIPGDAEVVAQAVRVALG